MIHARRYAGETRFRVFSCIPCAIARRTAGSSMMMSMLPLSRPAFFRRLIFCLALIIAGSTAGICAARDHTDGFDEGGPAWSLLFDRSAAGIIRHLRTSDVCHGGQAAELIDVEVASAATTLQMAYPLPPARLIDDTRLSVWFQSNQDGVRLSVRVVLPNQIDPDTGKNLTVLVDGDSYTKIDQWQKLECTDIDRKFRQMLPQLRQRLQSAGDKSELDLAGRFVDTAVINIRTSRGTSRFVADELQFGPIVDIQADSRIRQVQHDEAPREPEAKFQLGQLNVRGKPYFMRAIPYHGEKTADLARMRFNLIWIPKYEDTQLLAELDESGLRAMAVPPRAVPPRAAAKQGQPQVDSVSLHVAPFGPETSPVLFWYLGTQIEPGEKREIAAWQEQIRNADRIMQRPLMGDVSGLERTYSQQMSMLGVHRSAVQSSISPKHYRDWLIEHRNLALPGTFLWTWIQTEPPPSVNALREAAGWRPQVVEPEQLRLQVYAALAAGCRGIAFWTHTSLDGDHPGAVERKLMIALLNMELELLEPLLATGSVIGQATVTVQPSGPARKSGAIRSPTNIGKSARVREQELSDHVNQGKLQAQLTRDLEAAMIHTETGLLVLPVWYADDAQYVPGPMAAHNVKIIVPGVGESARAYEFTTTEVRELQTERVTGGTQVILRNFDTTAAIFFTENGVVVERIREKVKSLREPAARITIELARAKLERVAAVDGELHKLGRGLVDANRLLTDSKSRIERADTKWRAQHFHDARITASEAMQGLRIVQFAHWGDAAYRMYSPISSPHTLCYQTLPDHWNMIARFGRTLGAETKNLLRSGDCEDIDTMVAEGWTRTETAIKGVRSTAELHARAYKGTYALRLAAAPATGLDPPISISERPVTVVSAPVTVYKGQLVYIRGWVKMEAPALCNLDGAVFYDSLGGPGTALHWRTKVDWQMFDMTREVYETTDLTLTMALTGLGDVRFDDLEIIPLDVDSSPGKANSKNAPPGARGGPWDFFRRLPGFGGKSE